jgi:hypothetical protein
MITLTLTPRECELIQQWFEAVREHSGHWGDGMAFTPDEDIVLGKIEQAGAGQFHPHHLEVIVQWAETSVHTAITPDEYALLDKIFRALGRDISGLNLQKPF